MSGEDSEARELLECYRALCRYPDLRAGVLKAADDRAGETGAAANGVRGAGVPDQAREA